MTINAHTRTTGLFGYPVEHSLSPAMHNAAFARLGLNYCYLAFSVQPDALDRAVMGARALQFRGFNVTVPHKERVVPFLDTVDREATFIGAVNTVVNDGGTLTGYNTDGRGFMRSLDEAAVGVPGRKVFIIGTGGAARAIGYYLCQQAAALSVFDIDRDKAGSLARDLSTLGRTVRLGDPESVYGSDILINATPLGLKENDPLPLDRNRLAPGHTVVDLIYKDTPLIAAARQRGCTTLNGLGMLLWQGVLAFELWTGVSAPADIMRQALLDGFRK